MSRMARHCKCDWIILNSLCGGMSYDTQQCMCNNGSTSFQDQLGPQVSTLLSLKDSLTNRSNLSPQRPALVGNRGTLKDHFNHLQSHWIHWVGDFCFRLRMAVMKLTGSLTFSGSFRTSRPASHMQSIITWRLQGRRRSQVRDTLVN